MKNIITNIHELALEGNSVNKNDKELKWTRKSNYLGSIIISIGNISKFST